jgi:hypothetical protein
MLYYNKNNKINNKYIDIYENYDKIKLHKTIQRGLTETMNGTYGEKE